MVQGDEVSAVVAPKLDEETLTRAHVVLCKLERELRACGRGKEADLLSYTDLVILVMRNTLNQKKRKAG